MKTVGLVLAVLLGAAPAFALSGTPTPSDQTQPPAAPAPSTPAPTTPGPTSTLDSGVGMPSMTTTPGAEKQQPPPSEKKKEPGRGDFDAGGQARLPNGPDAMGKYAAFNWVAFDLKGRYFLLD